VSASLASPVFSRDLHIALKMEAANTLETSVATYPMWLSLQVRYIVELHAKFIDACIRSILDEIYFLPAEKLHQ
jgi:hypothetical protein